MRRDLSPSSHRGHKPLSCSESTYFRYLSLFGCSTTRGSEARHSSMSAVWYIHVLPRTYSVISKFEIQGTKFENRHALRNKFRRNKTTYMKMGNNQKIQIPSDFPYAGVFELRPFNSNAASKASELLQKNHDNYHIYIHNLGLHSIFFPRQKPTFISLTNLNRSHTPSCPRTICAWGDTRATCPSIQTSNRLATTHTFSRCPSSFRSC